MNKVKKFLLGTTAMVTLISTSAFADICGFYLRGNVGGEYLLKNKITIPGIKDKVKFKSSVSPFIDLNVGYYSLENVRVEFGYIKPFNIRFKKTSTVDNTSIRMKRKISSNTLMGKVYVDFYDYDVGKFYVGGGLGFAQNKEKITSIISNVENKYKSKKSNNLAWMLALGNSFAISDTINIYTEGRYEGIGKGGKKFKTINNDKFETISSKSIKGFSGSIGLSANL